MNENVPFRMKDGGPNVNQADDDEPSSVLL